MFNYQNAFTNWSKTKHYWYEISQVVNHDKKKILDILPTAKSQKNTTNYQKITNCAE